MKADINDIMRWAAEGYYEPYLIHQHWDPVNHCVVDKTSDDTLALFLVREIKDAGGSRADTLRALDTAMQDIKAVRNSLENNWLLDCEKRFK